MALPYFALSAKSMKTTFLSRNSSCRVIVSASFCSSTGLRFSVSAPSSDSPMTSGSSAGGFALLVVMARLGQLHVHAAGQHGRNDHEDDEEHEADVDERRDVDLALRAFASAAG